ncbi:hypothetical protein HG531_002051 [Fusarium graminearum]|nr:hypothetical protein HG531_002051 [Fusarium graminearum]
MAYYNRRGITRTSTACLHEITLPGAIHLDSIQAHSLHKLLVCEVKFLLLGQFFVGIKSVCEAKVGDNNVAVTIEKQVFKLQVAVHYSLLVEVPNARHKLGKQATSSIVFQVSVVEDIVEKFTSGCVFKNDTYVSVCLDLINQTHNVGVLNPAKDGNLALHLAEFTLTNGVAKDEIAKFGVALVATAVVMPTSLPSFFSMFACCDSRRRRGCIVAVVLV